MPDSREYPSQPIVGVGVLVFKEDAVLLIRRGKAPRLGEWTLPGGAIELGETVQQAAEREIAEECGIRVANCELLEVVDAIVPDEDGRWRYTAHGHKLRFCARPGFDALAGAPAGKTA